MAFTVGSIIIVTAVVGGIVALFAYHFRRLHLYLEAAKFPGPRALPVIGNALSFLGDTTYIFYKIMGFFDTYPSLSRVWIGNRLFILMCEAEHMKTVFLSQKAIDKSDIYQFVRPWLGTGLITASAEKWKVHRKLIQPIFNIRILESFVNVFAKQSQIMTDQMRKELTSGKFDVFKYMSLCTLDIICETAMGIEVNAQTAQHSRFVDSVNRVFEIMVMRVSRVWLHPDFTFNFSKLGKEQHDHLQYLHSVTNNAIREKRNAYRNITEQDRENAKEPSVMKKSFLDLMMGLSKDNKTFTDEELREEVDTMLVAGYDAAATINTFVMLMLANNPEVQERAYQELCEIYGDAVSSNEPIKSEDLKHMEYLERVIEETMRLFPIAPVISRQLSEDLKLDEYTLPKGSSVVLGIMRIHRWEKYWPDPLKFDPDRFLPSEVAQRHPYCYVPFSAGPRNCIGIRYAMLAMKVLIATVLRRYVLKNDKILNIQDIELKLDGVLKPANPVMIRIEERHKLSK